MAALVVRHLEIQFCASLQVDNLEAKLGLKFFCHASAARSHGLSNFSATVAFLLQLERSHQGWVVQSRILVGPSINQAWLTEMGSPALGDICLIVIG